MFSPSDIGKKVLIHNKEGASWIKKDTPLTIRMVHSSDVVTFSEYPDKKWSCSNRKAWSFVGENEIKIGETYIIKRGTATFEPGEKVTIKGFVDDDTLKPVPEGLCSGGWLKPSNLIKVLDIEKLRFRSLHELIRIQGWAFPDIFRETKLFMDYFGKPLNPLTTEQHGEELVVTIGGEPHTIYELLYTEEPPVELFVVLDSAEGIAKSPNYSPSNFIKAVGAAGKLLSEFDPSFKDNDPKELMKLLRNARSTGVAVNMPNSQYITLDMLRIVEKEQIGKKIKYEEAILPF